MKKALAILVTAALAALTPGQACWAALAETRAASAPSAAPVVALPALPTVPTALSSLTAPVDEPNVGVAGLSAGSAIAAPLAAALAVQPTARPVAAKQALVSGVQQVGRASNDSQRKTALDRIFTAGKAQASEDAVAGQVSASAPSLARAASASSIKSRAPPAARGAGLALAAGLGLGLGFGHLSSILVAFPVIIASLILHEMGHAWAAYKLGDPTAVLQNRLSFKLRDLRTHIDPVWTIVVPLVSMLLMGAPIGGAVPVPVNTSNFRRPARDMALVAIAGPAVNFILAGVAALALPFAGPVAGVVSAVVYWNALLGAFNLFIPFYPLDGHHVLRALLPRSLASSFDRLNARLGWMPMIAFLLIGSATGILPAIFGAVLGLFSGLSGLVAGAVLPAVAALGLIAGQLRQAGPPLLNPDKPVPVESVSEKPVELVVAFDGSENSLKRDAHLSFVDIEGADGVSRYGQAQKAMLADLNGVGFSAKALADYNATPIATYRRINAATFRVDASRAADFTSFMKEAGMSVYPNDRRKIITPVPVSPENDDPQSRNPVSMAETLKVTRADGVVAEGGRRFNGEGLGPISRLLVKLFGGAAPQPAIGVIDSGAATDHPLLKNVKAVVNVTDGENKDDIGHGSWVTSMVLNYVPWSRDLTHYKTFKDGGATLDDILKALTVAGNDGNLVISNSWGSDDGDPESPDSRLVKKLAEEGHIMVFAAGNAGSGANTIGSPAIVHYKDPKTGALRVVAVAAADRNKKIAYFSSRGLGSPVTSKRPDYPLKPDATAVGYNTEGAWPGYLDADRVDPKLGPLKAISGTSMSTPDFAGAVALLATMFGVTALGPQLDAIVNALMQTLEKTGQPRDAEGEGFLNVQAAYDLLKKTLTPVSPNFAARLALRAGKAFIRLRAIAAIPGQAVREYESLSRRITHRQSRLASLPTEGWSPESTAVNMATYGRDLEEFQGERQQLEKRYPGIRFRTTFVGKVHMGLRRLVGSVK